MNNTYCDKCQELFQEDKETHDRIMCPNRKELYAHLVSNELHQMNTEILGNKGKSACTTICLEAAYSLMYSDSISESTLQRIVKAGALLYSHYAGADEDLFGGQELETVFRSIPRFNTQLDLQDSATGLLFKLRDVHTTQVMELLPHPYMELLKRLKSISITQTVSGILTKPPETVLLLFPQGREEVYLFDSHPRPPLCRTICATFQSLQDLERYLMKEVFPVYEDTSRGLDEIQQQYYMFQLSIVVRKPDSCFVPLCLGCSDELHDTGLKQLHCKRHFNHIRCHNRSAICNYCNRATPDSVQQSSLDLESNHSIHKLDNNNAMTSVEAINLSTKKILQTFTEFTELMKSERESQLKMQDAQIALQKNYDYMMSRIIYLMMICPTAGCRYGFLWIPELDNVELLTPFACQHCKKSYCFICRVELNNTDTCNHSQLQNRHRVSPGLWWKICPHCSSAVEVEDKDASTITCSCRNTFSILTAKRKVK